MTDELAIHVVHRPACAIVRLSGPLSPRTVPQISGSLGKTLVNRGCVVVDLSGLRLEWEPAVGVFGTVLCFAGGWPSARMVLFNADEELVAALHRSCATRTVPLVGDLGAALLRVQRRPDRVRRYRDLPPEPTAVRAARALVREACAVWEVNKTTGDEAAVVVTELAVNALVHAGTSIRVSVELIDEDMEVGVRDFRTGALPRPGSVVPDSAGPLGLYVVSSLAGSWGVTQRPDGKTVWARFLRPDSPSTTTAPPPGR